MTGYGTQDDGTFRRKHVDTILDDLERSFKNEAGDDVELRQNSPQKAFLDTVAPELARLWVSDEPLWG